MALVRAYANIADELESAGYSSADIRRIKQQLNRHSSYQPVMNLLRVSPW